MNVDLVLDWEKMEGLVPAIVQNSASGRVLMVGYVSKESLQVTLESRKVTFYSRSRKKLWQKGETSGNTLDFVSMEVDCDRDALLINAVPNGPTCHRNTLSCFDQGRVAESSSELPESNAAFVNQAQAAHGTHGAQTAPDAASPTRSILFLKELENVIRSRKGESADSSYTASLFAEGVQRMAQKVGEEGVEVALAAVACTLQPTDSDKENTDAARTELLGESADLVYHLMVLLTSQGLSLEEVVQVLESRHQPR